MVHVRLRSLDIGHMGGPVANEMGDIGKGQQPDGPHRNQRDSIVDTKKNEGAALQVQQPDGPAGNKPDSIVDTVKRHPVVASALHTIVVVVSTCALIRAIGPENIVAFGVQAKIAGLQKRLMESQTKVTALEQRLRDAGCPSITDVISRPDLNDLTWRFRREPGPELASSLRLDPLGTLSGYSNPNEDRWQVTGGNLVFVSKTGAVVTRFRRTRSRGYASQRNDSRSQLCTRSANKSTAEALVDGPKAPRHD